MREHRSPRSRARGLLSTLLLAFACAAFNASALEPIPDKLVVLTFDDANKSDRSFVAEVLKKHGFGATFYVTEGLGFLKSKAHYTTWAEIRELHDMGFEIGNHTQHHRNVARLDADSLSASLAHIDRSIDRVAVGGEEHFLEGLFAPAHGFVRVGVVRIEL